MSRSLLSLSVVEYRGGLGFTEVNQNENVFENKRYRTLIGMICMHIGICPIFQEIPFSLTFNLRMPCFHKIPISDASCKYVKISFF